MNTTTTPRPEGQPAQWMKDFLDELGCEPDLIRTSSPTWGARAMTVLLKHAPTPQAAAAGEAEQFEAWFNTSGLTDAHTASAAWKAACKHSLAGQPGKEWPMTKDGRPIKLGMTFFTPNPDTSFFGEDYFVEDKVQSITLGVSFNYKGEFTVCGEDIECGNMECYALKENVPNPPDSARAPVPTDKGEA